MTEHMAQSLKPDGALLLRELNHRVKNELTSAICKVSAKAVLTDSVAVKAALLEVVDLLHECADVHRALRMPEQGRLTDAARYLQQLCVSVAKYRLDRSSIRVLVSLDVVRLEGERCWRLGMILSELLTNVSRHAKFDDRHPELQVRLLLEGNIVKCGVFDNGSMPGSVRRGRGLRIVGELASSLGGRVQTSSNVKGHSFLLTFPLTEEEQRGAGATREVQLKGSKTRRLRQPYRDIEGSRGGRSQAFQRNSATP
jgi:two-component sensor histidine kinase